MADRPRDRPTPATFLADVASHKMTVAVDSDLYRHVRFAEPGTGIMAFSLTTWPGRLAFSGDMGDFCFAQLPDMFEFFRRPGSDVFAIDLGYWMEKVTAQDAKGGMERYSPEKFRKAVLWDLDEAPEAVLAAAREEVLSRAEDGRDAALAAADAFESEGWSLPDFWDHNLDEPTYRFVWACYAIAWGIAQYDAAKAAGGAHAVG